LFLLQLAVILHSVFFQWPQSLVEFFVMFCPSITVVFAFYHYNPIFFPGDVILFICYYLLCHQQETVFSFFCSCTGTFNFWNYLNSMIIFIWRIKVNMPYFLYVHHIFTMNVLTIGHILYRSSDILFVNANYDNFSF
jgi:hypothetical protein